MNVNKRHQNRKGNHVELYRRLYRKQVIENQRLIKIIKEMENEIAR